MNHEEEIEAEIYNRTFSIFLISIIIAVFIGFVFGCIVTIVVTM